MHNFLSLSQKQGYLFYPKSVNGFSDTVYSVKYYVIKSEILC